MSVWKPIATAAGCTALLGMVAGMKIPTEMVIAAEPEWRGMVEKTFAAGSDDRKLYEAGPEDLYVPKPDPMAHRVAYDAMEYMSERAVGPDPTPVNLERSAAPREIMPVALTAQDVVPARTVVVAGTDKTKGIVRVVSGTRSNAAPSLAMQPLDLEQPSKLTVEPAVEQVVSPQI
ncbi:hypothetical protein [Novosphingobium aquimarinum]|uniref:hypothetical protein n=1 Tax=Novosphingobium aquimarinum TaxID=2682494 RepID=UPI0018DC64A5|nr:hypothetical protein [Novosphingobium aquimarinum]